MKYKALVIVMLMVSGCNVNNDLRVTAYKTVYGEEAFPWDSGCLVTVENRTQSLVAVSARICNVAIGEKAIINKPGDSTVWINNEPFGVRSAKAK